MFSKFVIAVSLLFPAFASDVIVHEWGTFTSVAGEDGAPVSWASLSAPSDLPCFVYRLNALCVKCGAASLVRMETPVVYFYSPRPATVSVRVDLPSGTITEWYPKASGISPDITYDHGGKIAWNGIQIVPGSAPDFPDEGIDSHYYPARNTDAAPLRVGRENEKLLFYRGIANQGVYLEAQLTPNGKIELRNTAPAAIPLAVVFENRDGKSGYRIARDLSRRITLELPELTADVGDVHRDLAAALATAGLYPKEAAAMIATWRDSWFEEGLRVFYILPRTAVDEVLPITLTPKPASLVRVFVGRVELLAPATRNALRAALASGDTATLEKCGRFLSPFLLSVQPATIAPAARAFIENMRSQNTISPCKQPLAIPTNQ
jgi:hypothetical protein